MLQWNLEQRFCAIIMETRNSCTFLEVGGRTQHVSNHADLFFLTSTICKLMERLITDRITWFLEHNHLLPNSQSGFRRNRSVIDHIHLLQNQINEALKKKSHAGCLSRLF
jgi:hypothetical protein